MTELFKNKTRWHENDRIVWKIKKWSHKSDWIVWKVKKLDNVEVIEWLKNMRSHGSDQTNEKYKRDDTEVIRWLRPYESDQVV